MIILPAIDIKGGQCVRLRQGDYDTAAQVAASPVAQAQEFAAAGACWLHIVDLDGAKARRPVNGELIRGIIESSGMKVELGGGIRDMNGIESAIKSGAARVILGSAALDEKFLAEAVREFGAAIAAGIDARGGEVAINGWYEGTGIDYITLAKRAEQAGVRTIIYTDIGRDGMLSGVNLAELSAINEAVSCDIIASGGVRDIDDITALRDISVYGAICGKSLYSGSLSLADAIAEATGGVVK